MKTKWLNWITFCLALGGFVQSWGNGHSAMPTLKLFWKIGEVRRELKSWSVEEFQALSVKRKKSRERNPKDGKLVEWSGVLVTQLLEEALAPLALEQKALIYLLVLTDDQGRSVTVSRALTIKYPFFLADRWSDGPQVERGHFVCVVPWTSRPKILKEEVPLEMYFLSKLVSIEFTSYQDRFSEYLLKKRTDPGSMRGERLFVENCLSCHHTAMRSPRWSLDLFNQKHSLGFFSSSEKVGSPLIQSIHWDSKHWKLLERYWEDYALENTSSKASWERRINL